MLGKMFSLVRAYAASPFFLNLCMLSTWHCINYSNRLLMKYYAASFMLQFRIISLKRSQWLFLWMLNTLRWSPIHQTTTRRNAAFTFLRSALRWCITKILASATDQSEHSEVFWLILMEYLGSFGTLIRHFELKLLIG